MADNRIPWKIANLIVARLSGTSTEDDEHKLDEWLEASPRHRLLYQKVSEKNHLELFLQRMAEHDSRAKYEKFRLHMAASRRRRWGRRWGSVAAVLIPIVVYIGIYTLRNTEDTHKEQYILPGQYQAILTLPGGESIPLAEGNKDGKLQHTNAFLFKDTLTYRKDFDRTRKEYHRITIPRGGEYMLKLSDGTMVWLNSETELRYPSVFVGEQREVFLKGEAYFEVTHDSLHPFVVETGKQKVTVLGTSFGIRAYEDTDDVLTTLEAGKVRVDGENQSTVLKPGDQARYKNGQIMVEKVNTSEYTAWHKGIFIFIDRPLEEILNTLSRWYNIEVFYTSATFKQIRFTGELQRYGDIRELLDRIEKLEKVRFEFRGRTVTVSGYRR